MKKLAVLTVLFGLSLALITGSASSLMASQDQVEVREVLLEGSRQAASGLSVTFRILGPVGRLGWQTSFTLTEGELSPNSSFTFEPEGPVEPQGRDYARLVLLSYNEDVISNTDLLDQRKGAVPSFADDRGVAYAMALDVASRTGKSTVRAETLRLRDFTETFVWSGEVRTRTRYVGLWYERQGLAELFPAEVPEDMYLLVLIAKDGAGQVIRIMITPAAGPADPVEKPYTDGAGGLNVLSKDVVGNIASESDPRSVAAAGDGALWVCPSELDANGRELVRFPRGRGVYCIPVIQSDRRGEDTLDFDAARLVYPTEEPCADLGVSGGNVELVTESGSGLVLTVLQGETGDVLLRRTLFEDAARRDLTVTAREGLRLYTLNDGRYALTVCEGGETKIALTGRLDFETFYGEGYTHTLARVVRSNAACFAWDGSRLAVAEGENYQEVLVLDSTGVLYHARFEYSPLWNGRSDEYLLNDARADTDYTEPMEVRFT